MNGFLNVLAALIIGAAIIWFGSQYVKSQNDATIADQQVEELKSDAIEDAKAEITSNCEGDDCPEVAQPEDPYAQGVAVTDLDATKSDNENTDSQTVSATETQDNADMLASLYDGDLDADTSDSEVTEQSSENADATENSDSSGVKPEDFFTKDQMVKGKLVSKPDTNKFFSEDQMVDGKIAKGADKKDDDCRYFTEERQMAECVRRPPVPKLPPAAPCKRADGTIYTGPGTALNPLADGDPCLPPPPPTECTDCEEDEPQVEPVGWTSPYQDVGPEFPRTTLGPRGSDYAVQVPMFEEEYPYQDGVQ